MYFGNKLDLSNISHEKKVILYVVRQFFIKNFFLFDTPVVRSTFYAKTISH